MKDLILVDIHVAFIIDNTRVISTSSSPLVILIWCEVMSEEYRSMIIINHILPTMKKPLID